MKNTILLLIAALTFSISASAQKSKKTTTKKTNVPEVINESFNNSFASVEKKNWEQTNVGNYVATFSIEEGVDQKVEYNNDGILLKTKTSYKENAIPEPVTTAVATKFPEAKIESVEKTTISGVAPYYTVKIAINDNTKKQFFVSEDGTIVQ